MAKYTGKDGTLKTGATPDTVVNLTGFVIEESAEALDASILDGSHVKTVEQGQTTWNGNIEVIYDPDDAGVINLDVGNLVDLEFYPIGDSEQSYIGEGLITASSEPIEVNGMIRHSVTLEGDDALVRSTESISDGLLLESGDFLLLESGDFLLLE